MQSPIHRSALAAGIAAALLMIAPGARADHDDRRENARARHAHEHSVHRHDESCRHHGPRWLRPDRHARGHARYHHARGHRDAYRDAYRHARRHGDHYWWRVTGRTPYYCGRCHKRFQKDAQFRRHLRDHHTVMHRVHRQLVRWYRGWAWFG